MVMPPDSSHASTTEASAAVAQSRNQEQGVPADAGERLSPPDTRSGAGASFEIGVGVGRAVYGTPYERRRCDPVYRPLKIFTSDPSASRMEGASALVNVPFEPLAKGPRGRLFEVVDYNETLDETYRAVDLNDPAIIISNGRNPSESDWYFHQQMVYAVCSLVYATFRAALGRHITWGFAPRQGSGARLRIRPHAFLGANAAYVKETGELTFGYYHAEKRVEGRNLPGGVVFTCLSHDIVAHEVTHALIDGLRAQFAFPSGPDVLAFHEGLADLVAIFQHFSYDTVVLEAIRKSRGDLACAELLTDIARQFNYTRSGGARPLRSAVESADGGGPRPYRPGAESHELGSVLVSAVFEAFATVFRRKTERYLRLAAYGPGRGPASEMPPDLQILLAAKASKLASQFLTICIRAIDYCPPVDLTFGEFLRALVTADYDLVPDDRWGYREALVDAFRRRHIYPENVSNLSEDALLWEPPERVSIPLIADLSFAKLRFRGDPARPASARELARQACALGSLITRSEYASAFGLAPQGDPALSGDAVEMPVVQSIRSSRRTGPDGQIVFDLIAEVTQRRRARVGTGLFDFYGGATIVVDPRGRIRYSISKRVTNVQRLRRQQEYIADTSNNLWATSGDGQYFPKGHLFKYLHGLAK